MLTFILESEEKCQAVARAQRHTREIEVDLGRHVRVLSRQALELSYAVELSLLSSAMTILYLIMLGMYKMFAVYIHKKERRKMKFTVHDCLQRETQLEHQFICVKYVVV